VIKQTKQLKTEKTS